jgi:dolichol-phosphate mannosyltransferase
MTINLDSDLLIPEISGEFVISESAFFLVGPRKLSFSLVIPTFNESKNIETLIANLHKILDQVIPNRYELIVVDDDSPDRTWQFAQSLIEQYPQLRVMRRQQERGLSSGSCGAGKWRGEKF